MGWLTAACTDRKSVRLNVDKVNVVSCLATCAPMHRTSLQVLAAHVLGKVLLAGQQQSVPQMGHDWLPRAAL